MPLTLVNTFLQDISLDRENPCLYKDGMTKAEMKIYAARKRRILALHKKLVPHPEIARLCGLKNRQRVWQIINGK